MNNKSHLWGVSPWVEDCGALLDALFKLPQFLGRCGLSIHGLQLEVDMLNQHLARKPIVSVAIGGGIAFGLVGPIDLTDQDTGRRMPLVTSDCTGDGGE